MNFSLKKGENCNKLIVEKINSQTVFFNQLLKPTNYMLSGSFLISILFTKEHFHDDYDLYFTNKLDLNRAYKTLRSHIDFKLLHKSKYAITFLHTPTNQKIQLVASIKKTLFHLAMSHDFINCNISYSSATGTLFIPEKTLLAWSNQTLDLNITPLQSKNMPFERYMNQLTIFFTRIKKYLYRYNLSLSKNLKKYINTFYKKALYIMEQPISLQWLIVPYTYGWCYDFAIRWHEGYIEELYNEICMYELPRL